MSYKEDLIPYKDLKSLVPKDNGRLEVAWRIYNALCHIPTDDLSYEQRSLMDVERQRAYSQYVVEGALSNEDGLQGPKGFKKAKQKHLKNLRKEEL